MVVRRNSSRRRRVNAVSEIGTAVTSDSPVSKPKKKSESDSTAYSYGANRRSQLKTTDLFPKRLLSVSLVVLLLLASIGILNLLSAYSVEWQPVIGSDAVDSLGLSGRGTLSSWFSSFLLIMTGLASLQIYALRQHRRDDYHGTYRLWIWMAGLFLLASVNCVVDLTSIATNLTQSFTSISLDSTPWILLAAKIAFLSILVARGMYEIRASRGAFALVVFVWVAYSAAALMQLPNARPTIVDLNQEPILGNCMMFATAALLLAHVTYARFIYLHAHGLIQIKPKSESKASEKSEAKAKAKADAKQAADAKSKAKAAAKKKAADDKVAAKESKLAAQKAGKSKPQTEEANSQPEPVAKTKTKRKKKQPQVAAEESTPAPTKSRKSKKKPSIKLADTPAVQAQPEPVDEYDEDDSIIKMSKAERRRKRKEERRRRHAA